MTREEHLQWCKDRALEYVEAGDNDQAFTSMASDLGKHDETREHAGIRLGMMMLLARKLEGGEAMRKFINGFN